MDDGYRDLFLGIATVGAFAVFLSLFATVQAVWAVLRNEHEEGTGKAILIFWGISLALLGIGLAGAARLTP
ncbi:hypothetical protein OAF82_00520 [bacterium]|nr:hypothetical protein [bacterium]